MDKPRVYIETSIPSFYFETRSDAESVARRRWTSRWWSGATQRFTLVSSVAVVEEISLGEYPSKSECLAFMRRIWRSPRITSAISS